MLRFAKAVAIYSLLVVPPVLGLVAILHLGEDLQPPRSFGGDWLLPASVCAAWDHGASPMTINVSQSGLRAVGKVSHAALSLEIDGDTITGEQSGANGCRLALAAQLAGRGPDSDLVGMLRWPGCTGCADQAFRASRAPRTRGPR